MAYLFAGGGGLDELGILGFDRAVVGAAEELPDDAAEMVRDAAPNQLLKIGTQGQVRSGHSDRHAIS